MRFFLCVFFGFFFFFFSLKLCIIDDDANRAGEATLVHPVKLLYSKERSSISKQRAPFRIRHQLNASRYKVSYFVQREPSSCCISPD